MYLNNILLEGQITKPPKMEGAQGNFTSFEILTDGETMKLLVKVVVTHKALATWALGLKEGEEVRVVGRLDFWVDFYAVIAQHVEIRPTKPMTLMEATAPCGNRSRP